ncbi:Tim21p SCDLUD_000659 [Saccharomycodes ludwigii]|uniref:Tim21p n=1 Tax=Saccharomycodes ludwigii TaxID=36035 RepID=UPI001E89143B|nr:hypothetical protein SCDLUD_000659 [Saccharomycodes ludwigii]KAH3903048.1 hypothetical protein SCDLUD_000659 [Saccharomycodes ludwigii]
MLQKKLIVPLQVKILPAISRRSHQSSFQSIVHKISIQNKQQNHGISFKTTNVLTTKCNFVTCTSRSYSTFTSHGNDTTTASKKPKKSIWKQIKKFTTFTASSALVIGALSLATIVLYLIISELFLPSGDTQIFNRAVNLIEADEVSRKLLQCNDHIGEDKRENRERLKAYGETISDNRWARNRPVQSTRTVGQDGKELFFLRFHVESNKKIGTVTLEAKESNEHYQPDFVFLCLDVPGEKRHYLIRPIPQFVPKPKGTGFLGLSWGPKK